MDFWYWDEKTRRWRFRVVGRGTLDSAVATLKGTADRLETLLNLYAATRIKIKAAGITVRSQGDFATEQRKQQEKLDAARDEALGKLADEREKAATAEKDARREIAFMLHPVPTEVNAALLFETQEQRAWQRVRQQLEGKDALSVPSLIQKMARAAFAADDLMTVSAIRAELPAWMEAREDDPLHAMTLLDAEAGKASERIAAILNLRAELENGVYRANMSLGQAEGAIKAGDGGTAYLVDWDKNTRTVTV